MLAAIALTAIGTLAARADAPKAEPTTDSTDLSWRFEHANPETYITWRRFAATGISNAGVQSNVTTEIRSHTIGLPTDDGRLPITFGEVNTRVEQDGNLLFEYIDQRDRENSQYVLAPLIRDWTAMKDLALTTRVTEDGRVIAIDPKSHERFLWGMIDFLEGHGREFVNQFRVKNEEWPAQRFANLLTQKLRLLPAAELEPGDTFTITGGEPANSLGDLQLEETYTVVGTEQRDGVTVLIATGTGRVLDIFGAQGERFGGTVKLLESAIESELAYLPSEGRVWSHRRRITVKVRASVVSPVDGTEVTNAVTAEIERWFADTDAAQPAPEVLSAPGAINKGIFGK
ncbi:MAG: hypothetical protein AAGI17_00405 [Planctomycetota bacterium]